MNTSKSAKLEILFLNFRYHQTACNKTCVFHVIYFHQVAIRNMPYFTRFYQKSYKLPIKRYNLLPSLYFELWIKAPLTHTIWLILFLSCFSRNRVQTNLIIFGSMIDWILLSSGFRIQHFVQRSKPIRLFNQK